MFSKLKYNYLPVIFYGFCFLVAVKSFLDNVLLHQLQTPVIWDGGVDLLTYIGLYSGFFKTIIQSTFLSILFDSLLFLLPLILIIKPNWRFVALTNFIIWLMYILLYNLYGTHQTHSLVGLNIMHIPFLFWRNTTFKWLWNGVRFYILWMMFSAGMWKVIRGSMFNQTQGNTIYFQNHVGAILESGYTFKDLIILNNPQLLTVLFPIGVLLELTFLIGFFTKKFDPYLVLLLIVLITGFKLLADATFYEWIILALPFLFPISLKEVTALRDSKDIE